MGVSNFKGALILVKSSLFPFDITRFDIKKAYLWTLDAISRAPRLAKVDHPLELKSRDPPHPG